MKDLGWKVVESLPANCGIERAKGGKVRCEFEAGHGDSSHLGRGRTGRWYSWGTDEDVKRKEDSA